MYFFHCWWAPIFPQQNAKKTKWTYQNAFRELFEPPKPHAVYLYVSCYIHCIGDFHATVAGESPEKTGDGI